VWPKATGFQINDSGSKWNTSNDNYIYMAIRRPNKPAKEFEPSELFDVTYGNYGITPTFNHAFPIDMCWYAAWSGYLQTRRMPFYHVKTDSPSAVANVSRITFDYQAGYGDWTTDNRTIPSYAFKRAPGFFDVVMHTGTGTDTEVPHGLGVKPDMIWHKAVSSTRDWQVAFSKKDMTGAIDYKWLLKLNTPAAWGGSNEWRYANPTDTHFPVSSGGNNTAGVDYVAFLFASVPGLCDIGSYVADYTETTIDCGFSNGARFVLIKRADDNGDWMYWDTLRGITPAGTDSPYLELNTGNSQNNADSLHPAPEGFKLIAGNNSNNIDGAEYIYMAIA
jgi:hypothetical protein